MERSEVKVANWREDDGKGPFRAQSQTGDGEDGQTGDIPSGAVLIGTDHKVSASLHICTAALSSGQRYESTAKRS
ncbi:hypothetical protein EYF80_032073 [Liparis tanakae]|uniref:Uncharacterized protein n=1 Tax=Liparis tanakae TaxID=230148 RepID=A0A4Z2GX70_9TELE|nr:hypothetical protein EYF80_032073 [Liparis tanakae]